MSLLQKKMKIDSSFSLLILLFLLSIPTTLGMGGNDTVVTGSDVLISSCTQLTVTARITGDDNRDGYTTIEYNTSNSWPGVTACATINEGSPRQCLIPGLVPGQSYWVRVTSVDPDGVSDPTPEILGPYTLGTCGADTSPPTILFTVPLKRATIGGIDRVKIQVWDEGGLSGVAPTWWIDSGAPSNAATINPNYNCGSNCVVWEFDVDWTVFARGAHEITVEVTDTAGNIGRGVREIMVRNSGNQPAGNGLLLRRSWGSQQCMDCHTLPNHSSQYTGTTYGNWAFDCLICHRAHFTLNLYLIENKVKTPSSGTPTISFWMDDRVGGTNPIRSYLGNRSPPDNRPWHDGICEACHTRTKYHRNTEPGDHSHFENRRCVNCHTHSTGFAAVESTGGTDCASCHPVIWEGMNGTVAKTSRHSIGSVLGINDSASDTNQTWTTPLSFIDPADRSCLNMCHQDHVHNSPGATDHHFNVHQDASDQTSRMVGRNINGEIIAGTPAQTDFDFTATNGGLCVSCHSNPVNSGASSIEKTDYDVSAHNYSSFGAFGDWTYTQHDDSLFLRNCTKCHADRHDGRPNATGLSLGSVHFSDYPDLLSGSVNPDGNTGDFICYNCHGNTSSGADLSGKDLAEVMSKTSAHLINSDSIHDSLSEQEALFNDGSFSGSNRHINCLDCHNPHTAKPGIHTMAAPQLAGALSGATGIGITSLPAGWIEFQASNFLPSPVQATAEYQICFKCHSSFAYGSTPPTGETDQALEFNVNGDSYHWIMPDQVASQPPGWTVENDTPRTAGRFMTFKVGTPWTNTSPMVCSDCHGNEDEVGAQGPHGSSHTPILSSAWTLTSGINAIDGLCFKCHDFQTYAGRDNHVGQTGFSAGNGMKNLHGSHSDRYPTDFACAWCHSAVPHGWNRKAMIVLDSDPAPYNANGTAARNTSWSSSNFRTYGKNSCQTVSGCH